MLGRGKSSIATAPHFATRKGWATRCFGLWALAGLCLIAGGVARTVAAPQMRLWAPTYYIAASAKYGGLPDELHVVGASNLPTGARLYVNVYRYIGQGGSKINESASVVVGEGGFFEVNLHPTKGNQFKDNLSCEIVFATVTDPPQPPSVLQAVGKRGEKLGFPKNPQAEVASGNFVLSDLIHVP
jgi:hypothetical protein